MQPKSETRTRDRDKLVRLISVIGELVGMPVDDPELTIGDLGIGSQHIVELLITCEDIYGGAVKDDALELAYETSILSVHRQMLSNAPV